MNNNQDEFRRIGGLDIQPKSIRNYHLESKTAAIKIGVASELPDEGEEYPFFFATDTGVFYAWDGSAWVSTTLT